MSRRTRERRTLAEQRWPNLTRLFTLYFNEDFDYLYGSLEGAFASAIADGSLEAKKALLKEWRDWHACEGLNDEDLRRFVNDGFDVAVYFETGSDARKFMSRLYEGLMVSVRAETSGRYER